MSQNIQQIFVANPASSMVSTDLLYLGRSPYGPTDDFAITFANFVASIGTATPTASTIPRWDAHVNMSANNFLAGFASTATAAATTTLTVSSAYNQYFTGSTTQTVVLPVTSTLALGFPFRIINNSTGVVTVQSSGANSIKAMAPGSTLLLTCILTSGTTAASWDAQYIIAADVSGAVLLAPAATQTISGQTLQISGSGFFDALDIITSSNDFVYLRGLNNTSTAQGALIFGSSADGSVAGNYNVLYNYVSSNFSFFGDSVQSLNLTGSTATFSGQVIAPSFSPNTTSGIIGTTTNDSAAAGSVGEIISSVIALASAVPLTTVTAANVTSIALTAGDWDVWGNVGFTGNTITTFDAGVGWISSTSATVPDPSLISTALFASAVTIFLLSQPAFCVPAQRFSLSGTTTIYLSALAVFSTSTCSAFGGIYARRRR